MTKESSPEKGAEKVEADKNGVAKSDETAAPVEETSAGLETLHLEGDLGIVQVDALYEQMSAIFEQAGEIEIDASGLNQVDTAGIQLLYAFIHDARGKGLKISWKSTSEALEKSAGQLGLSELLGL